MPMGDRSDGRQGGHEVTTQRAVGHFVAVGPGGLTASGARAGR